jgi:hypothetical protein
MTAAHFCAAVSYLFYMKNVINKVLSSGYLFVAVYQTEYFSIMAACCLPGSIRCRQRLFATNV